jgi:hypothetical protein
LASSKEAVTFVQLVQLARVTACLHVHIELSISSVEAQLNKHRELVQEHYSSEDAVIKFMSTFPGLEENADPGSFNNYTIPNFSMPSAAI